METMWGKADFYPNLKKQIHLQGLFLQSEIYSKHLTSQKVMYQVRVSKVRFEIQKCLEKLVELVRDRKYSVLLMERKYTGLKNPTEETIKTPEDS